MRGFIASFVKGQVLLLAPQPILIVLILLNRISLYYSAPVIISLAVLWGWFDYSGKAQRRGASVLRKLERLVDDFGRLNFQEGGSPNDERIISLLDKANFGSSTRTTPQLAMANTEKIKEVYFTLELWYHSMRQKVRLLLRKAGSMIEYDLLEVVNAFLQSLHDDGLPVSETKVRALELDPWFKTGTEASAISQSSP